MKSSKGVTLISLIITIIVILILTIITINFTTNEDGVMNKAISAKENQAYSEMQERIQLETVVYDANGTINLNATLQNISYLNSDLIDYNNTKISDDNSKLIITLKNGESFSINGKATIIIKNKTLNPTLNDFKTAFDEGYYYKTWGASQYANARLTYTNGSESIQISVGPNDTMPTGLYVYVNYTNSNSETINYACSSTGSPRGTLEDAKFAGTVYDFVEAGRWQLFKGTLFTGYNAYSGQARVFEDFNETVVFPGNWTIDESNSNDLGKTIFEKVLIDITE